MKSCSPIAIAFCLLIAPLGAMSAEVQSPTQVTASIPSSCNIVAPSAIAFGDYDATGPNRVVGSGSNDKQGTVGVRCNAGSAGGALIKLSMGPGLYQSGAGCINRRMRNEEGSFLRYEIHTNVTRTNPWGCHWLGEVAIVSSAMDSGATYIYTMQARIPGGQGTASVGNYHDTMGIIITF